jgi:hypothetical protein
MNIKTIAGLAASVMLVSAYAGVQNAQAEEDTNATRCISIPIARNFRLDLLVDGNPLPQIHRQGRVYVEAPRDKDFDIRVTCPSGKPYLAVCSVDGLSIMNGKTAASMDDGYVICDGSLTIPGFRLNQSNVAHFHFGDRSKSYAKLMGKPTDIGVIGLKIFADARQRQAYRPYEGDDQYIVRDFRSTDYYGFPGPGYGESKFQNSGANNMATRGFLLRKKSCDEIIGDEGSVVGSQNARKLVPSNVSGVNNDFAMKGASTDFGDKESNLQHDMGTEFGEKTAFLTKYVDFLRGTQVASFAVEYASHDKLVQAGIIPRESLPVHPNPFPADSTGCVPPPGWRG